MCPVKVRIKNLGYFTLKKKKNFPLAYFKNSKGKANGQFLISDLNFEHLWGI